MKGEWLYPLLFLLLAGCVSMGGDHYTVGQRLFASKEYHKSLEELAKTPPSSPSYQKAQSYMQRAAKKICVADFLLRRAIAAEREGKHHLALSQVNKVLKVYPHYKPALMVKAQIVERISYSESRVSKGKIKTVKKAQKKPPQASSESKESRATPEEIKENYNGSKRLYYRGKKAYQNREIERAKRIWKAALRRYPLPNRFHNLIKKSLSDLLVKEGLEHYGAGRWTKAIASWREAIEIDPAVSQKVNDYIDRAEMNLEAIKELEEGSHTETPSR